LVDIGGIVDYHRLKFSLNLVDIGGIIDYHCLKLSFVWLILVELLTITV
jgi:hypothetical protein